MSLLCLRPLELDELIFQEASRGLFIRGVRSIPLDKTACPKYANTFQTSACVVCATVPLPKGSDTNEPRVSMGCGKGGATRGFGDNEATGS